MAHQTILEFIKLVNLHDAEALSKLMTDDHQFIDAHGTVINGKEKLKTGWDDYFQQFPNYKIEAEQFFENGDATMITGYAGGIFQDRTTGNEANSWRIPAAWKAVVADKKIKVWQVFADTRISSDMQSRNADHPVATEKVSGIGGIFFKSEDPKQLMAWYVKHLGFQPTEWGGISFKWRELSNPEKVARTEWSIMKSSTTYLDPSKQSFMINYRVADLDALLKTLREQGATVMEKSEDTEYGKFGWVLDGDGNKIELWEPPKGE